GVTAQLVDPFQWIHSPDLGDPRAGQGESPAVGTEGDAVDTTGGRRDGVELRAPLRIPQPEAARLPRADYSQSRRDQAAVGTEGDAQDVQAGFDPLIELARRGDVPDREEAFGGLDATIVAASHGDEMAVRAEGRAVHAPFETGETVEFPTAPRFRQGQFGVVRDRGVIVRSSGAGDQQSAVGAERDGLDRAGVPPQGAALVVTGPLHVVPFPTSKGGRTLVEEPLSLGDAGERLALGQVDAVDVEL